MTSSAEIKESDLIFELGGPVVEAPSSFSANTDNGLNEGVKAVEDKLILETLVTANGIRKNTAERLGISARTLRYKIDRMREAGIEIPA